MTARRSLLAFAMTLACFLWVAARVGAATPYGATNFKVSVCGDLAPAAPEGVLVPICAGRTIGMLGALMRNGELLGRPLPYGTSGPFAAGSADEIWAGTGSGGETLGIDRIAADGTVTTFALGTAHEYDALEIYGLVPDGPGSVWVAIGELAPEVFFHPYNSLGGELVHIAADGTVTRFAVPAHVEPHSLVRGPDGNLWFVGERGRSASEHVTYLGKGYVGRMSPAGDFALFPTATEQCDPRGIAVGPDGRLWFTETSKWSNEVGTIGTGGAFGPSIKARDLEGPLGFGPDGNVWLSVLGGVMRITSQGQHTLFPLRGAQGMVVGGEGDIWTHQSESVQRIVPGAPGIDIGKIKADRPSKTVRVQLACGGSERGCNGTLTLSLGHEWSTKPGARLARARYKVAAESHREMTMHLSSKAFDLARRAVPKGAGADYIGPVVVHATVAGGPTLDRRFYVPGLATNLGRRGKTARVSPSVKSGS